MEENANINGAQQLAVNDAAVRRVDLPRLIIGATPHLDEKLNKDFETLCGTKDDKPEYAKHAGDTKPDSASGRECLEKATAVFNADTAAQDRRRNDIQARLMAASDAECAQFVQHLNSIQGFGNLMTGSAATILSGAGAIATHVNVARAFGGLGAIMSGVRAEFNSDLFLQQAAPTVSKAIGQERGKVRAAIVAARGKEISEYPLWAAIGDAFQYNDQCSLVKGLSAMDRALDIAENPGPERLEEQWVRFNRVRQLAENPRTTLPPINFNGRGTSRGDSAASSTATVSATTGNSLELLSAAYQQTLDAAYAGELRVFAVSTEAAPAIDLAKSVQCSAEEMKATGLSVQADCLRRAATAKMKQCVGDKLSAQYLDWTNTDAVVRATSSNPASIDLANATLARDKSVISAKAQSGWIAVMRGYLERAFKDAEAYASKSARAAAAATLPDEKYPAARKKESEATRGLADQALQDGAAAVDKMTCLQGAGA